ncbi:AIPR family protein [Roseovarius pacificus]|uniref:AIPR family protein n=1 Tax=Roseovarius pacificus TaxID=337701 RepID=UPI004039C592
MSSADIDIAAFRSSLIADINEARTGGSATLPDFSENIFTDICTSWLSEVAVTENPEVCHFERSFGSTTARSNGYAVSDDETIIDVFVACFGGSEQLGSIPPEDVRRASRQARTFLEKARGELLNSLDPAAADYGMVERIRHTKGMAEKYRIIVLTDSRCSLNAIESDEIDGVALSFEVIDVERLYRLVQAGLPRDEILVDFTSYVQDGLSCLHAPEISADYDAYLALIPGEILYQLYDRYGPRLLEKNVRSFLQARGKVNKGIRDTLRTRPDRFLAYNNGIVATVDEIEVRHDHETGARHITRVRGLQIVNGGQTTASIHRARRDDKVDLSSVYVPAKISLIDAGKIDEIVPAISLYANSQNNIQMADFSANDPYHVEISRLSAQVWCPGEQTRWFYERTRGEYEVEKSRTAKTPAQVRRFNERTPRQRKFDKVELAKFLLSWDQRPDKVSLGGQKCFSWFMQDLSETHSKGWLPDEPYYRNTIAKAILYKQAVSITRKEAFPAYRAQVATYVVAYLSHRTGRQIDLERIWKVQDISDELVQLMRGWSYEIRDAIVETSNGKNVTEWCKKADCWKAIRALGLALPKSLPPEVGSAETGSTKVRKDNADLTPAELDAMHRCQGVSAQDWIAISQWGAETGHLKDWQSGIAATLSGYAARDWTKAPSPKQAKRGVEILQIAEAEGASFGNKKTT